MKSSNELVAQYIERNPHRPGLDEARLKQYGVAVWALIGHLPAVNGDITQVAENYQVPLEAVQAALAYYEQHRSLIDARILSNSAQLDDSVLEAA